MTRDLKPIDIGNAPDLLTLAQDAKRLHESYLLLRGREEIAVLLPAPTRKRRAARARPVDEDDALFRGIGSGHSGNPGGILRRTR